MSWSVASCVIRQQIVTRQLALSLSFPESQTGNFPDSTEPLTANGGEGFRLMRVKTPSGYTKADQWLCTFVGESIHGRSPCLSQTIFVRTHSII